MEFLINLMAFVVVVMLTGFAIRIAFNIAWFTAGILWKPAVFLFIIVAIARLL